MNSYLRQATASQSRAIGPFLDSTDFQTAETGLTIANTDIKLIVNGGASANKNSGGGTHRANGVYGVTFDATDSATVGEVKVSIVVAGALPVFHTFFVLEEAVYDALFAAAAPGYLQPTTAGNTLDVAATGEAGIDLSNIKAPSGASAVYLGIPHQGTLSSISNTTVTLPGGNGLDHEGNFAIYLVSGTNAAGKSRYLTYSGTGEVWTVDPAWNSDSETTPSGTIVYLVLPAPKIPTTTVPTVNISAAAVDLVWDEATSGHTTAGTTGKALSDAQSAGDPLATDLPGAYTGTQAGAILAALSGTKTDTAAIKTKTDLLPSVTAGTSGGLPTVDTNNGVKLSQGTGTGQVDLDQGKVALQSDALTGITGYVP